MFDFMDSQKGPSREEIANYLGESDAEGGFSGLESNVQTNLIDAVTKLTGMEQSETLQRLRNMDSASATSVIGQLLQGQGPTKMAEQGDTKHYTVKPGDSLWKISRAYNIGLKALTDANPQIKNPDLIHPGQTIHIP